MAEYHDSIIAKLIEKLNDEGPEELRNRYYYGDVLIVPKSELPVCSVAKNATRIRPADNLTDEHLVEIVINVLWDYTEDLGQSTDLVAGSTSLYEVVEGRDENYQLRSGTIAYVLRKYQQLDTDMWLAVGPNEVVSIDYGMGINRRGPGIFSVEAVVRVTVRVHKVRVSQL